MVRVYGTVRRLPPPSARYATMWRMGKVDERAHVHEVDVVPLNDAPPLLRHRAIRDGRLLLERDARQRIGLDTDAVLEYLDTAPLRRTLEAELRRRLEEGTFGRR